MQDLLEFEALQSCKSVGFLEVMPSTLPFSAQKDPIYPQYPEVLQKKIGIPDP